MRHKLAFFSVSLLASLAVAQQSQNSSEVLQSPQFDTAAMIPLTGHTRGYFFSVSLCGGAINGDKPYDIFFDTGSPVTSVPYGCINKKSVKVLEKDVKDGWGRLSDKVQGQLALMSVDGKTRYTLDDYIFFARKKDNGEDAADDRGAKTGNAIMGASPKQWGSVKSFPLALAEKYGKNGDVSFGIVSYGGNDIDKGWPSFKAYLQIGNDPRVTSNLHWRTDLPKYPGHEFGMVPGFKVTFSFSEEAGKRVPDIVADNLMATLDTGANEMVMRLRSDDPHRSDEYKRFFTVKGTPWRSSSEKFMKQSLVAASGVNLRVEFTDSENRTTQYSFKTGDDSSLKSCSGSMRAPPTYVIVGDWTGAVPFGDARKPYAPSNRINLGDTIYFFCPVVFYDIARYRVGFHEFIQ